jgi:hypothetical protein
MDLQALGDFVVDRLEELQELCVAVAREALPDHRSGQDIQRCDHRAGWRGMNALFVVRCVGGVPRTFPTVRGAARALLASDGPTEAVGVMMAGGLRERGLTQSELRRLGRALKEAREARVALEVENEQLASVLGLA